MKIQNYQNIFSPSKNQKVFSGTIERITYKNEENDYIVARFRVEDSNQNLLTIIGNIPSVVEGERLKIEGEWQKHKKFGLQFKVNQFTTLHPVTRKGIELYLSSGLIRGIGPVYAEKIVNYFGLETIKVLDETPDRLLEVDGIGKKRLTVIKDAWGSHHVVREIMIFLAGHGISSAYALKIFKQYGMQTLNVLKKNPYQLADDVHGIGFLTADKIAQNIGIDKDEPARIEAGIKYVLTQASEQGHLFLPESDLVQASAELLKIDFSLIETICVELYKISHLINDDGAIYLSSYYNAEQNLAERLHQLQCSPTVNFDLPNISKEIQKIIRLQGIEYNEQQALALHQAVSKKILVITGGPGTGKTTVLNGIIRIFDFLNQTVFLTAPTGRAAKRLAETTGKKAQTIHRLLDYEPQKRAFQRNQKNPLKADVIVVDEMSMVDCVLANHLIRAVPLQARLVLVGDVDQLPSVGAGNVLRDIIDSKVIKTIHLTQIFRQASDSLIVLNAHQINRGLLPQMNRKDSSERKSLAKLSPRLLPKDDYGDFLFVQEEDPGKIVQMIKELCLQKLPKRYSYQAKKDIQILTPMYRGELGADNLNSVLQETLNPQRNIIKRGKTEFRVGDRVMQVRNNYDKRVFNGDLGSIRRIDQEEQNIVVAFEKMVSYDFSELDELILAYAITVHKSQGSEYPVVIMPLTTQHYVMLQRNLLYTAVTRAKELIVLIGTKKALAIAIKNNRVVQRNTKLAGRIAEFASQA